MYCPNCQCEFDGWVGKCPDCRTPLLDESPHIQEVSSNPISYEALVDLVRENGGQLNLRPPWMFSHLQILLKSKVEKRIILADKWRM